ncbi:uncharacterized protein LOC107429396 isoform X4 [Ziziphus jujuba]|uniref:Uncharacterized protein LOC107429396 isoform X4 n=1 Tax=Ziziphus jujuba TaxID=326968 RepID=A0ABM3I1A4_ZIZJJ|nr:uncharacterized protein LOC107429396 isoform X4 [Ziziphus jujuba]
MAVHNLCLILKNHLDDSQFLLLKQPRPPKFGDDEYDSYVDSDLWDLPSTQLNNRQGDSQPRIAFASEEESYLENIDLRKFDVDSALNRILGQVGFGTADEGEWKFWKHVEEAEFGPGPPVHTVFIVGSRAANQNSQVGLIPKLEDANSESYKWMSVRSCLDWLLEVKPNNDRVGPLVVTGLLNDSLQSRERKALCDLKYQEYPPGVTLVPMRSRTAKPFDTTNLVVFAPDKASDYSENINFVAHGDALIVDPGCCSQFHKEVYQLFSSAILMLLCWHMKIPCVVLEKGHTDGHLALLHVSTHSLIVGDHCVGQGSAVLDITSGGNMTEYFKSTYNFMDLSPHILIPMHGRVNLWPKHMLCAYLKNRRSRETSILKAIENGAQTLFDIVANVYSEVDHRFWIPAASNVRLHVDHLAQQDKLPKDFSIQKFKKTCRLNFLSRWILAYLSSKFELKHQKLGGTKLLIAGVVVGFSILYCVKDKLSSK